jgi:hypothetical protein
MNIKKVPSLLIVFSISLLCLNSSFPVTFGSSMNYTSSDPNAVVIQYCLRFSDSVKMGTNVVQDLIGAGILPSSYYDKTCQEEINKR